MRRRSGRFQGRADALSQACLQRFRLKDGGLRFSASKQCKSVKNPSKKCGSEIVGRIPR
jgi:hypothetical protein